MNKVNIDLAKSQINTAWMNDFPLFTQSALSDYMAYVKALEGFVESFIDYHQSGKPSLSFLADMATKLNALND